ncbi:type I restriction endonuclease [Roseixanthobacter liquoris]|uniref:type I restriction endonuclease n=1 Tax=Roseixanthobacter liquoris TaxID=3119921 RepID=UPI003729CA8A
MDIKVTVPSDFREKLVELARRAIVNAPRCQNEEATKMFLVLPLIGFLGYDHLDPNEVFPEHHCDFSEKYKNKVDYAIFRNGHPIIAVECKQAGAQTMRDDRGQLRSYFNAAPTVKMGILTDGLTWEFYADSDSPNMMDENAFLRFDMKEIAKGQVDDSILEGLFALGKAAFDPENIGAEAKRKHVYNSVLVQITTLAEEPSEQFIRDLLSSAGFPRVSQRTIEEYRPTVKAAFRDFISRRILQRLDLPQMEGGSRPSEIQANPPPQPAVPMEDKITTTEIELKIFGWVKHRLAFLVNDEKLFKEIEHVSYQDFQGNFAVFYKKSRVGRMFDFYEPKAGARDLRMKFVFPTDSGAQEEVLVTDLSELDSHLLTAFKQRVAQIPR